MKDSLQRLWMQIYGDKKKFTMICGLVLVGLLLWGRLLLKQVPRTATAAPVAGGSRETSSTNVPPSMESPQELVSGPEVVLDRSVRLQRDLFAADPAVYGKSAPKAPEPTKSPRASTDRQLRVAGVRDAARHLSLQSVIAGQRPRVMINGQVLEVGQSIAGFEVIEMSRRFVVLEKNGIKVHLGM